MMTEWLNKTVYVALPYSGTVFKGKVFEVRETSYNIIENNGHARKEYETTMHVEARHWPDKNTGWYSAAHIFNNASAAFRFLD